MPISTLAARSKGPEAAVRLNRRDWRLIGVAILIAAASLAIAVRYFHRAFPAASIHFRVTRTESAEVARRFLQARGWSPAGYRHAAQFGYDSLTQVFLERELGLARSQRLIPGRVALWRWENRWFRPLRREEFDVAVTPGGQVVGFRRLLPADAPGANLTAAAAQRLAEQFLQRRILPSHHLQLSDLALVSSTAHRRLHRTDYVFTWRDRAPLATGPGLSPYVAQAQVRREITVQGGVIGGYRQYLELPQAWVRSYRRLRSQNQTASTVDSALILLLGLALLIVLAIRLRRAEVRWRAPLWIGGAGAVLSFLATLNQIGQAQFAYDTTQSYPSFLASFWGSAALQAIAIGLFLGLLAAAAEPLYRDYFPQHIALEKWLSWPGFRSKAFLRSVIVGLMLACFFFAYQTVFYLAANHFGAWAPADVPYDALLNTRFPWIFVLLMGYFPAIFEEFMFRMGAIPLLAGWLFGHSGGSGGRRFSFGSWQVWGAVVIAAFIWGFGHSAYPNEPFFIRGVEVGIGGVILGWILIRFGILTTVVWHYTVDAIYTAMLLWRSPNAYFRWSGGVTALIAVLPLAAAAALYWRRGGFAPERDLSNAALREAASGGLAGTAVAAGAASDPAATCLAPHSAGGGYVPVHWRAWLGGLIAAAILLAAFLLPWASWSRAAPVRVSRRQAIAAARQYLEARHLGGRGDHIAAALEPQVAPAAAHRIFAAGGRAAVLAAYAGPIPALAWRVRFFRPLQPDEINVWVSSAGGAGSGVVGVEREIAETAPGAAPPLADAEAQARAGLAEAGVSLAGLDLLSAERQTRPARADATIVWQAAKAAPGGVHYRVMARVLGARFGGWRASWHVAEADLRAYRQASLGGSMLGFLRVLLIAGMIALVGWRGYRFAQQRDAAWRGVLLWSVAGGLALAAMTLDGLPRLVLAYPNTIPWAAWLVFLAAAAIIALIAGFLITAVLLAAARHGAPAAWTGLRAAPMRRAWARDALAAGLLALAWMAGWQRWQGQANAILHRWGSLALPSPAAGNSYLPALGSALGAGMHAVWLAALLAVLFPAAISLWRRGQWWWLGAGFALLALGTLPAVRSLTGFGLQLALSVVTWALALGFAALFLRANALAYLSAALLGGLVPAALADVSYGPARFHWAGYILLALAAAWLLWLAWQAGLWAGAERRAAASPGGQV